MVCPASAPTRLAVSYTQPVSVGRRAGPGARLAWLCASVSKAARSASPIRMQRQKGADRAGLHAGCWPWPGDVVRRRGRSVPGRAAPGQVSLQPVTSCTNPVLHGWLKTELTAILARLPTPSEPADAAVTRAVWQDGLTAPFTLPKQLPP